MIDDQRLNHDEPNETIDYLSTQEIGVVISRGLSETYQRQPKNPVDFLGKWLLHQVEVDKQRYKDDIQQEYYKTQNDYYKQDCELKAKELNEIMKIQSELDDKEKEFYDKIDKSEDLEDNLQDLTDYLQEYTKSTSVYVAKLVPHKNEINEDDDETAHVNENATLHLDIYHVSPEGFNFIQRKKIEANEGIVHDVFKEVEEPPQAEEPPPETVEAEGEGEAVVKEPEEPKPQHIIVPEVVREPRIKYFKVPRLGSLL